MRQRDLDILLHEGEGSMLEYKESFSSSLAREFVAFANSAGGKILLGARDDGIFTLTFRPGAAQVPRKSPRKDPACTPQVTVLLEAAREPVEIQWYIMGRRRNMKGRGREEKL